MSALDVKIVSFDPTFYLLRARGHLTTIVTKALLVIHQNAVYDYCKADSYIYTGILRCFEAVSLREFQIDRHNA